MEEQRENAHSKSRPTDISFFVFLLRAARIITIVAVVVQDYQI